MSRYANKTTTGTIGTIVSEDGSLLMIQRQKEPFIGKWSMPGGKLEMGEHPTQAMVREFFEETGLHVEIERFCGIVSEVVPGPDGDSHFLLYVFRLQDKGGDLLDKPTEEGPLDWYSIDELQNRAIPSDLWIIEHMVLSTHGPRLVEMASTDIESTILNQY